MVFEIFLLGSICLKISYLPSCDAAMRDFLLLNSHILSKEATDGEVLLPRCTAFELRILNDSIGIRLKKTMHLGKNSSPSSLAQSSIKWGLRLFLLQQVNLT